MMRNGKDQPTPDKARRRLFDGGPGSSADGNGGAAVGPPPGFNIILTAGPSRPPPGFGLEASFNSSFSGSPLGGSPQSSSFLRSPEDLAKVMNNPEKYFDQIVQRAMDFLAEANETIANLRNRTIQIDVLETEYQVGRTLNEVTDIANDLKKYVEETSYRRALDSAVNPRVVNTIKSREQAVLGLVRGVRACRTNMQLATADRARRALLDNYGPFDRPGRTRRDAEEMVSDSTERLLNSKRILLETIQSSSGTLTSLAASSQTITSNDQELHTQTGMVSYARNLLKKYGRRASTDKLLIWVALMFFGFCVFFVVYRRLF